MAIIDMFQSQIDSPIIILQQNINNLDSVITISDSSGLLQAPNTLTLGYDEDVTETIKYTSINGNQLTVIRGFDGNSKSWVSGTKMCRAFTSYDYNTLTNNINYINDKKYFLINVEKFSDNNYIYFLGDSNNGWESHRWNINNIKTECVGNSNKPTTLEQLQNLIYE